MAKTKISEFDVDPANNTDINSINIAEGCAPSGINNAIRQLMSDLKEFQTGAGGDPFNGAVNGTVGATTPNTGAFTTLSASGAFSANGGVTLGDASGDALTINSSAVSIPNGLNFGSNNLVLSSGNVGIGTSSPASKLDVITGTNSGLRVSDGTYTGTFVPSSLGGMAITTGGAYPLIYYINGAERMRIDSSGNVGIGTTSPNKNLETVGTMRVSRSGSPGTYMEMFGGSGVLDPYINVPSGFGIPFQVGGTERMRIDSSGNLLVGRTSQLDFGKFCLNYSGLTNNGIIFDDTNATGTSSACIFKRAGTNVGAINTTATTTSYVTSSDYRLKHDIQPMTGALAKVAALKPVTYKWNADDSAGEGFIAHELQAVVPDCVTGEKDAVDAEGNPQYQGIDTSFLVATLTASIQELKAIVDAQAERIAVLESK